MPDPERTAAAPPVAAALAPRGASLRVQAVANTVGNLALYAVIFLLTPLAIRELGDEGWGIWQIVGATTAYAGLLALGLGSAIHYQVAYNLARGDVERIALSFTSARAYLGAAGLALLALLALVGRPLIGSLVEARHVELAWSALLATIVPTAITLPLRIYPSSIGGLARLDIIGLINTLSAVVLFAAIWFGFRIGMDLRDFSLVMTLGALLPMLPAWFLAHRLLPRGSLRFTRIDGPLFRELIGYSVNSFVYVIGTVVFYQTMKLIAAWRCGGVAAAGQVGLSISIVQTLGVVFVPLFTTLLARFGQLHGSGQVDAMRNLLTRSLTLSGAFVIPSSVFLLVDAHAIFSAWVGDELADPAMAEVVRTTRLMLTGQAAYVFALPCFNALLGINEHRSAAVGMLVAGVANAGLGWWVAGSHPQISALAWVFSAVMIALVCAFLMPVACKRFGFAWRSVLVRAVLAPLAASLPGAVLVYAKPTLGEPIADLILDALLFGLGTAPGLELLRRRALG